MHYYKILIGSLNYHGSEALTYSFDASLPINTVVRVPLQKKTVLGVIIEEVTKPAFPTKPISETFSIPPLPEALVWLANWLHSYYPAPLGQTMLTILPNQLTPKTIAGLPEQKTGTFAPTTNLPPLTKEQSATLQAIDKPDTYILHGDTGTGKTRVYVELAMRAVGSGKSAIILTPEISLTSQLAQSFRNVFNDQIVVIHSGLTPKERELVWLKIIDSPNPLVVLGPRSALFSPIKNIGLIVVDEFHEPAYKQEQAPHYHAVRVASALAQKNKAILILGSATPLLTDYFIAQQKNKLILRMTEPANKNNKSHVITTLIDLKKRELFSRSNYVSDELITSVKNSLSKGEQSLLYLNRRGTARVILCNNCGWQAHCPHCDLPLTYHHDNHILQCHTCGYNEQVRTSCPECGNTEIIFKVAGTKAIEEEAKRLFPNARVMRFDTDNKKAERFEHHYDDIREGKIDILVGTQLLAKGLDLPKLTTLGVIIADTSLTFPDYSAEERTYQLLNQVIGRVGRGHSAEERVYVQSYDPERAVIKAALENDWRTFYTAELAERRLFGFPPYYYVLKLACRRASSTGAEKAIEQFMYSIRNLGLPVLLDGPTPSFHARIDNKYEWQLIAKSKRRDALLAIINNVPKNGWTYDIDPINLL